MKPPLVFQSHLDFHHGELDQAPRDLFEGRKIYTSTIGGSVSRVSERGISRSCQLFPGYLSLRWEMSGRGQSERVIMHHIASIERCVSQG